MLAQELREITDNAIIKKIEAENRKIIDTMKSLAENGIHYVTYPTTRLSDAFIVYLQKEGLKLYGRCNNNEAWCYTSPEETIFPTYNEIMIMW